ncbi:hypothetical protein NEOLEDRAFT_1140648 [Neolentinus lepideus HHB14362 ss-1]|uniref:Uncharacterized protein n=1 Tax=Neolentinus lepideus HHB14362 ss-1 TaxID=1314782 RepID=A0A165P528_9AGAM|nr:hypothetical protein NEOLEDRAFT_1140648 [Neolentinus lepideus HHB14362 ss-1]
MYSSRQTAQNVRLPYETTGRNIDPNIGNSDRSHFSSNLRPDCVKQRKAQISLDQR